MLIRLDFKFEPESIQLYRFNFETDGNVSVYKRVYKQ